MNKLRNRAYSFAEVIEKAIAKRETTAQPTHRLEAALICVERAAMFLNDNDMEFFIDYHDVNVISLEEH